jgi:DNA processing protein
MTSELTERQATLILNGLPGLGPAAFRLLLAAGGGDPRTFLRPGRRPPEGLRPEAAAALGAWAQAFDLAREEARLAASGADFVISADADYPILLRQIPDPPTALYRKGSLAGGHPCIAIVGSRRTTAYGQTVAKQFAGELAQRGFCIVSGLARGIDTAAHEGALEAGGKTAAVLGTGLDVVYPPENLALYRRVAAIGVVFSENYFGRKPDRHSFVLRNRIVAGMSSAVVVVESAVDGGAMITARFAGEQGRTLFAVPGRIDQSTSAGCHQLIRDGATLVTGVDDILSELNYLGGLQPAAIPEKGEGEATRGGDLTAEERTVLGVFRGGEILPADAVAARTGLPAERISAALLMLEIKRRIAKRIDGAFEETR